MLKELVERILVVTCLCAPTIVCGADFGIRTKHFANVEMYRPPFLYLSGRTLAVNSRPGVAFSSLSSLESAVARALAAEFAPATGSSPDLSIALAVVNYQPAVPKRQRTRERRTVKVGDTVREQEVPVEYWEAHGSLAIEVDVRDRGGNILENRFGFKGEYFQKIQTAVNGVADVKDVTRRSGESFWASLLPSTSRANQTLFVEPTVQSIETAMISSLARQIQVRYTKHKMMAQIRLAVPEPLRPGNELAMAGQWENALSSWKSASIDPRKDKGEKDYNMAVGNVALFYARFNATGEPADFEPFYQEASRLYDSARKKEPGEEQYQLAMSGLAMMRDDFARATEQWAAIRRDRERLEAVAKAKEHEAAEAERQARERDRDSDPTRPDSTDEAAFRKRVRLTLRDASGQPSQEVVATLVTGGADYNLRLAQAERVVKMEVTFRQSVAKYRQEYTKFFESGHTIDTTEREVLDDLTTRLGLAKDAQKDIEAQLQAEMAAARPAPSVKPQGGKPAAPKPVQVAKPAPAKPVPAAAEAKKPGTAAPPPTVIKKQ